MKRMKAASLVVLSVLLAGCAPGAAPAGSGEGSASGDQSTASGSDSAPEGGDCAGDLDADLKPFSSDLVTEPIPDHAVYGDGSEISFTTSLGAGLTPGYELLKFVEGTPTSYTGGFWEDAGDGRYTLNLNVFDSDLDGKEGLIEVTAFPDGVTFDGERYEGENVVLGIYCVVYAVGE